MDTLDFPLEIKALSEAGEIEGYGAVFNNVDEVGDRIVPGAFSGTLDAHLKAGTMPMMLWNHDVQQPIGVWTDMVEDKRGLKVKGRFVTEAAKGAEVYALVKAGAIRALSIGYRSISDAIEGNVRLLKAIDLWEISPVSFPANQKARITAVKTASPLEIFARKVRDGVPPSTKEFEELLREAGFPKALATQVTSVGYAKAIRGEPEGKATDAALSALRDAARSLIAR